MDRRRSSHVVSEIYEATINPGHWDYVIAMIAKLTGSKSAFLYYKNKDMDTASTVAQYGLPEDSELFDCDPYDSLDNIFNEKSSVHGPDDSSCIQFYPGSNGVMSNKSEIYLNWMQPHNIYHVGGAEFADSETHRAGITILRDEESGCWNHGELRVVDELLPHLRRALNIHSEFTHLRLKQDALLKGLDRLVIGLILYDRNANPVYINPTAQAIIETHPAMHHHYDGLFLINKEEDRKLKQTIKDTAEVDPEDSWKESVAIGIKHPDTQTVLPILITPMHAQLVTSEVNYEGAKVAVFLSDPNLQQPISVASLISVYTLTPAEAQVAISIANGHSIDEMAKMSHHSAHTVRTQLKSIFRKTGTSRQSELLKLLLTGSFAHRRRSAEN
jgi:DNA-binding CsgD family transcriptional regulator